MDHFRASGVGRRETGEREQREQAEAGAEQGLTAQAQQVRESQQRALEPQQTCGALVPRLTCHVELTYLPLSLTCLLVASVINSRNYHFPPTTRSYRMWVTDIWENAWSHLHSDVAFVCWLTVPHGLHLTATLQISFLE